MRDLEAQYHYMYQRGKHDPNMILETRLWPGKTYELLMASWMGLLDGAGDGENMHFVWDAQSKLTEQFEKDYPDLAEELIGMMEKCLDNR